MRGKVRNRSTAVTQWPAADQSGLPIRTKVEEIIASTPGGTGDVVGPASAVTNHVVSFNGTTGKLIKDSGVLVADVVVTTDSRLSDARTPTTHATSHKSGGSDAIKLDELAAPTDVTTLNASITAHGLSPKAVAPAAGLLSVLAIGNGETVRTDQALFDTTNPAALGTAGPGTSTIAARRDHIHALPALDAVAAPTDITTLNVSTSAHGLTPKLPNDATKFLDGTGAYDTIKDADLVTSDVTTNDVSTSKHGLAPKAPNDTTRFLRGDAGWSQLPTDGAWTNVSYTSTDFTAGAGTWTVDAGDVVVFKYKRLGTKFMVVQFYFSNTSVAGLPGNLLLLIPGGFTAKGTTLDYARYVVGGVNTPASLVTLDADAHLYFGKNDSSTFGNSTNGTDIQGTAIFEIN